MSHAILTQLSSSAIGRELAESKSALEDHLGHTVDMLAYPDGGYSAEVIQAVCSAGYHIAVTTIRGRITRKDQLLCLPRIDVGWVCPANEWFNENLFQ